MKNLIIISLALSLTFASCKKDDLTLAQLLGTWTEIQPCLRDSNACYILQFASNNIVYESSPFVDTGHYALMDNNTIRLDSTVAWGPGLTGSIVYQIILNGNDITIKKFYTSLISFGVSPNPTYDLHLKKM